MEIFIINFALIFIMEMKAKKELIQQSTFFKDRLEMALGALGARYGIDCFYIGDALLPDLLPEAGICSLYLALDIRNEEEKERDEKKCIGKDMLGYSPSFARAIFNIDGSIIENAQFNSVLLTPKQVDTIARSNGIKLNIDYSRLVYEIIAVNEPHRECLEGFIS